MRKIVTGFKDGEKYLTLLNEFINRRTEEARFLKQIDKLEMIIQAAEYEETLKDKKLQEFFDNARKHVNNKELKKLLSELELIRNKT